ncbi:hypothetical protein FRC09_020342 [Ceratobasidium sp. 395]|nr:hypothetical protein FRC09_020342 [Ceratobasidium sp. 395]
MSVLRQDSSSRSGSVGSDEFTPAAPKPATLRKNQRGKPFPAHPDCVYDGDSPGAYDANQTVDLNDKKDLEDKLLLKSPPLVVDPAPQRKSQSSRSEISSPLTDIKPTPSQADIDTQLLSNALYTQISQLPCSAPSSILDSMWATDPLFTSTPHDIGGYGFVQPRVQNNPPPELPLDLPSMDLVYSLVDVFFSHWGFARHFIHMPTFKQRIRLPTSDPNFPSAALLHGICAMGSVYLPQPGAPAEEIRAGEPVRGNMFRTDEQVNRVLEGMASFGEHQTMLAQIKALNDARTGKRLLESVQGNKLLFAYVGGSWYIHGRDTYVILLGTVIRLSIPLGLTGSRGYDEIVWGPNFGDTSYPNFKESFLPSTDDFVEQETRKRSFWMAFAPPFVFFSTSCSQLHLGNVALQPLVTDRTHSSATAWPAAIDELDIGQSFPYPLHLFEAGVAPGPDTKTQKLSTPDLLTNHPTELTDDGILYLKAIEL